MFCYIRYQYRDSRKCEYMVVQVMFCYIRYQYRDSRKCDYMVVQVMFCYIRYQYRDSRKCDYMVVHTYVDKFTFHSHSKNCIMVSAFWSKLGESVDDKMNTLLCM